MQDEKIIDHNKLRGRIVEKYKTCSAFADELGWKLTYLSAKLAGKIGFTFDDVILIVNKLEIPECEIWEYFFKPRV